MNISRLLSAAMPAIIATTIISITACSGNSNSLAGSTDSIDIASLTIEEADSPAYKLGNKHALELIGECSTTGEIRDRLLDIRAREHIIRTQVTPSSANAYIKGFEDAMRQSGDTLAKAIL